MLDKSVSFIPITMFRTSNAPSLPKIQLPEGYHFVFYQLGDAQAWCRIETAVQEFESIKRDGEDSIKRWIDKQLAGTTVTVVLIGSETLDSQYVQYEIKQSYLRGNAIIAIKIGKIKNLSQQVSLSQSAVKIVGKTSQGELLWFDEVIDREYDYIKDDGVNKLENWIENCGRMKRKQG